MGGVLHVIADLQAEIIRLRARVENLEKDTIWARADERFLTLVRAWYDKGALARPAHEHGELAVRGPEVTHHHPAKSQIVTDKVMADKGDSAT